MLVPFVVETFVDSPCLAGKSAIGSLVAADSWVVDLFESGS